MWILQASSYHEPVRVLRGALQVSAVFERSWQLQHADGEVLTVSSLPYDGPMAVRVGGAHLGGLGVRPGMRATLDGESLLVGPVRVNLAAARGWSPGSIPLLPLHWRALAADLIVLQCAVADLAHHPKDAPWRCALETNLLSLRHALIAGDLGTTPHVAGNLLGLGPGLTPTGDDILCGLLATSAVLARRVALTNPLRAAAAIPYEQLLITHFEQRTTALSRTLLTWAARGVAAQPLLDVLWSLGTGGAIRGLEETLSLGHTSGRDILTGVALAISVLCEREEMSGPALAGPAQRVP